MGPRNYNDKTALVLCSTEIVFFLLLFFLVPWEPSKSLEKQVRGHLYSSLLENLRPYTQYKARIRAANDLGTGDPSNVIVVSTKMKIPVERNINRKRDTSFSRSSFLGSSSAKECSCFFQVDPTAAAFPPERS